MSATPFLPVTGAGARVPLVSGGEVAYANLDYAASAPALVAVRQHVDEVLPYYASVHRGAGYLSQVSTSLYESARNIVRRHLGARDDDLVIFTRNSTDALNLLAKAVPGPVLVLDIEHHANLLPWQSGEHRVLLASSSLAATVASIANALEEQSFALLAVTGASNVTGELLPLAELAAIAHRNGARLAVDAAQLVPHRRVDIAATGIDYLAFSGHKVYAPFGSGVLVGPRDWLDAAAPYLLGGGAVRNVTVQHAEFTDGEARHEAGSPNVIGAAAIARALEVLGAVDETAWLDHERHLVKRLRSGLDGLPEVRTLRIWPDSGETVGVVSFTVAGHDSGLVAAYLSAEHGIGVRDGRFCAHPLLASLDLPAGALRASIGVGSSQDDVDRLIAGLHALLEGGPRWGYEVEEGRWVPRDDPRAFPAWAPKLPGTAGAAPCAIPAHN
ncbi:MAG: cysteine desulfurase [Microbacteriaceae bacterium]|jgi:selenocysteine lyase/cysteine desulfurase|nr:cysteine desulfurase [Microbacteriaceae bacterium]